MFVHALVLQILMLTDISLSAPQKSALKGLSESLTVPELQPPPITYAQTQSDVSNNTRIKRCGGGGGCHRPAPSKTYHISITVKKAPAPRPKPVKKHPVAIAVVPVAVVPITYSKPVSRCCSGGGGGGGGGKKWHKGK